MISNALLFVYIQVQLHSYMFDIKPSIIKQLKLCMHMTGSIRQIFQAVDTNTIENFYLAQNECRLHSAHARTHTHDNFSILLNRWNSVLRKASIPWKMQ